MREGYVRSHARDHIYEQTNASVSKHQPDYGLYIHTYTHAVLRFCIHKNVLFIIGGGGGVVVVEWKCHCMVWMRSCRNPIH